MTMRYKRILAVLTAAAVMNTCGFTVAAEETSSPAAQEFTLQTLEGELQSLHREIQALREEIEKLREENRQLKTAPSAETESYGKASDALRENTGKDLSAEIAEVRTEETSEMTSELQSETQTETAAETPTEAEAQTETVSEEEQGSTEEDASSGETSEEQSAEETAAQQKPAQNVTDEDAELVMMEPISSEPEPVQPIKVVNEPDYHNLYIGSDLVVSVQIALNELGYYCGEVDGVAGEGTSAQITAYQTENGLEPTGTITDELLISLLGMPLPGTGQEALARTESNARMEDAGILEFTLADSGRQNGAYDITLRAENKGKQEISGATARLVWYDQTGTLLGTTQTVLTALTPGAQETTGASLQGDENSWNVVAVGVAGYEYTLNEPDANGFTSYRVNLQTGVVKGK